MNPRHSFPASIAVGLAIATMALGIVAISAGESWPHALPTAGKTICLPPRGY